MKRKFDPLKEAQEMQDAFKLLRADQDLMIIKLQGLGCVVEVYKDNIHVTGTEEQIKEAIRIIK